MGLRSGIVVCATSFLLGCLFTHWIADSLTLWKSPVTDAHLWTAWSYYALLAKSPAFMYYVLSAVTTVGGATIIWSFRDGEAGNLMFDGGSIFLFGTTVSMYLYSILPSVFSNFDAVAHEATDKVPPHIRTATLDLASNHLICSVALTGVLALQAGRHWAESADDDERLAELSSEPRSRARTPGP